jgi:ribulose-phosphate 3-epimerase
MIEIIPALLPLTEEEFLGAVQKLGSAGIKRVHLDICDGEFVPTSTILGYEELARLQTSIEFDIHLMVRQPERYVDHWWQCATVRRFIVHVEATDMFETLAEHTHSHGHEIFAAINPDTHAESLESAARVSDGVQFMTVHPGAQGQSFLDDVVPKISRYHRTHPGIPIMVDGGITPTTAPRCAAAGASILVSGSYILKSDTIEGAIASLRASV